MSKQNWNSGWEFTEQFSEDLCKRDFRGHLLHEVELPHTNTVMPYHYFHESCYQMICGYRKVFIADANWKDKKIFITFEGIAHSAVIYMNEIIIGVHKGGYTAFTVELTDNLHLGEENVLVVKVDSRESLNFPPFGNVIDYMTYGGIYRSVYLEIKEYNYIRNVFVRTTHILSEQKQLITELYVAIQGDTFHIKQRLMDGDTILHVQESSVSNQILQLHTAVTNVQLWDIDHPKQYLLITELYDNNKLLDSVRTRFGFRTCDFRRDGFYLNSKKIKICGLNRHQSFPYTGYAMPKRLQEEDVSILKNELGVNAVRTSHYPQDQAFFDACDKEGLLVFTELPGWQHIGDADWKAEAGKQVAEMIIQNRNHPSIILWGVRINESQDDDSFYTSTNKEAHQLDPSRQTSGVRFMHDSHLFEDVYSYNDFSHNGCNPGVEKKKNVTKDLTKGYLISEYNGHMFPTKAFDDEEHRLEHALRHARVIDAYYGEADIAGGFGWCMFDYNTHQDFGSGDRICYHGVMDMFRNPKLAAAVYASQHTKNPVMEISSSMDIGEHPACNLGTVYVFTNADSIRLYKNQAFVKEFYPDRAAFPNMPHPPVAINDFVGEQMEKGEGFSNKTAESIKEVLFAVTKYGQNNLPLRYQLKMLKVMKQNKLKIEDGINLYYKYIGNWGGKVTTYRFEAIKDGKVVAVVMKEPTTKLQLEAKTLTSELVIGDTYDATSVRLSMKDQNGNLLPYYQEPLLLRTTGPLQIIGPSVISLKGGMGGTYVRTTDLTGEGTLTIYSEDIEPVSVTFHIRRDNDLSY